MPYKKLSELNKDDISMICSHHYACGGCPFINMKCACTVCGFRGLHKESKVYVPKKLGKYCFRSR